MKLVENFLKELKVQIYNRQQKQQKKEQRILAEEFPLHQGLVA